MQRAGRERIRGGNAPRRLGLILTAVTLAAVTGCARPAPEEALRTEVAGVQASIQQRDAAALGRHLSGDFVGPGGINRDQAPRLSALQMMRHQSVAVTFGPLEIELREPHATVRFRAVVAGGSGRWVPDMAGVYRVETGWRMEDGAWKITSARWTRAL